MNVNGGHPNSKACDCPRRIVAPGDESGPIDKPYDRFGHSSHGEIIFGGVRTLASSCSASADVGRVEKGRCREAQVQLGSVPLRNAHQPQ